MQSVNRRIAAFVLCFSHESTKGKTRGLPEKMISLSDLSATRTTRYYDDFLIISKTNLSLSWLENLVRLCMLPSVTG